MKCPFCGYDNLPGADQCEQCLSSLTQDDIPQSDSGVERSLMEDPVACLQPIRPLTVDTHTSLADALELMRNHQIGCLFITAEQGTLAGILTERDLLLKVAGQGLDYDQCRVEDFMSPAPECSKSEHPLAYALHRMIISNIHYLPLVDENDRPEGIISSRDVIAYIKKRFINV